MEKHPASWLFDQGSETLLASGINYFQFAEASRGWPSTYLGENSGALGPDGKPVAEQQVQYERLWSVADVFQALVRAGLNVVYLGEHPNQYWRAVPKLKPELRARIPMTFSIVGFGGYHYKYASGREGDWLLTGFSPRKREFTVYIMPGFSQFEELMGKLGRHKTGKSCLYIRRLDDIQLEVLRELIGRSLEYMRRIYQ